MKKLNTPSYSVLLSKEKQIRSIQELYENVGNIQGSVSDDASESNPLVDKDYVDEAIASIPAGPEGPQGPQGPMGPSGYSGAAEDLEVVQVSGDSVTAVMSQKAVTDEVENINENLQEAESMDFSIASRYSGAIDANGAWTKVQEPTMVGTSFLKVKPKETYIMTAEDSACFYTIIDTMFDPSSNKSKANIDYANGYDGRVEIAQGNSAEVTIPADGHFLLVRADLSDGGAIFVPALVRMDSIKEKVLRTDKAATTRHYVTENYFDRAHLLIVNGVATYIHSVNWSSKILPVKDLIGVDLVGSRSSETNHIPPVVFLRGAEPTQENWIQGAEIYGTGITNSPKVFCRLTSNNIEIPAEATHVLLQNSNTISTSSHIESYIDVYAWSDFVVEEKGSSIAVVDIQGNGDFTSISAAVDATADGDTILVYPGTYEESVHAFGKKRHIVGICKDTCILTNGTGNYSTPPLEANIGSISNMTIIADNYAPTIEDPTINKTTPDYCIHIESANDSAYQFRVSNCIMHAKWNAAIGLGLRYNQTVIIEDCDIRTECVTTWSGGSNMWIEQGAIFFHNDAVATNNETGHLRVSNCRLRGLKPALSVYNVANRPYAEVEFDNNTLISDTYGVGDGIIYRRGQTPSQGYWAGDRITLSIASHGNNIAELNA